MEHQGNSMFSCIPESNKVSKSESLGLRVENNSSVPKLFISLSLINCINPRIKNCLLKSNRIYHLTDPWRLKGELRAHIVGWNISQVMDNISETGRQSSYFYFFFTSFIMYKLSQYHICIYSSPSDFQEDEMQQNKNSVGLRYFLSITSPSLLSHQRN